MRLNKASMEVESFPDQGIRLKWWHGGLEIGEVPKGLGDSQETESAEGWGES